MGRLPTEPKAHSSINFALKPFLRPSWNSVNAKFAERHFYTPGWPGIEVDHHALLTHALLEAAMSAPTTPLRVMPVEDERAFREALAFVLAKEHELEVVAQAGSLVEARQALDGRLDGGLDVALLDLALPDGDGTELIAELRRSNPSIKVLVLSATIWPRRVEELLLRAEVDAVIDKWKAPTQIAREVRREGGGG